MAATPTREWIAQPREEVGDFEFQPVVLVGNQIALGNTVPSQGFPFSRFYLKYRNITAPFVLCTLVKLIEITQFVAARRTVTFDVPPEQSVFP